MGWEQINSGLITKRALPADRFESGYLGQLLGKRRQFVCSVFGPLLVRVFPVSGPCPDLLTCPVCRFCPCFLSFKFSSMTAIETLFILMCEWLAS